MNLTGALSTLWSDRDDLAWLSRPRAGVGYLGWLNRGNLGDEAMFLAHQQASPVELRRVPQQGVGWRLASRGRVRTLVLGGGTLLGRREWTQRLERAIDELQPDRVVTLGVGVEEPEFALAKGLITEDELQRQVSLLQRFDRIGVRGPRSVASLAALGVTAEVLGDPALALTVPEAPHPGSRPTVLLSLAHVSNGYADDAGEMRRRVALATARVAAATGAQLIGLAMEPQDQVVLTEAVPDVEIVVPGSVPQLLAVIAGADLVVGERLHANILAAAMRTRFVAIGYKPKTFDFVESLGGVGCVVDSRAVEIEDLHDRAMAVLDSSNETVAARVGELAARFHAAVRKELG